jgi:hypothetical protein
MTGITPRAYLRAKESRDTTLRSVPVDGVAPPDELKELHDFG